MNSEYVAEAGAAAIACINTGTATFREHAYGYTCSLTSVITDMNMFITEFSK